MAVVKFLVAESSASIGEGGVEVVDQYLVSGLTGPVSARAWLATQQSGIPRYGDRHPAIAGISADSVSCRAEDTETFRVTVTSRRPQVSVASGSSETEVDEQDFGTLEFFYLTRDVETQFDAKGSQITVSHTFDSTDAEFGRDGLTFTQAGTVQIQTWQQGIRFSRRESKSPADLQGVYGMRLNSSRWNGYDEKTVMCIGIDGDTSDGGQTWTVNYAFMLDPFLRWKKSVIFSDEKRGGDPPPNLKKGVGFKTVDVYQTIDFSGLNIDFSRLRRKTSGGTRGVSPIGYPIG